MSSNVELNNRNFTNNLPASQKFSTTLCSLPISSVLIFFVFLYKLSSPPADSFINAWHRLPLCSSFQYHCKDQHSQNNSYAFLPLVVNKLVLLIYLFLYFPTLHQKAVKIIICIKLCRRRHLRVNWNSEFLLLLLLLTKSQCFHWERASPAKL